MNLNNKADNIRALQEGLFGNAPRQWQTLKQAVDAVGWYTHLVARPRVRGGKCWYDYSAGSLIEKHDFRMQDFYFNIPIDPTTVLLNAEVMNGPRGPHMFYSTVPMHMRPALSYHGYHASGLKALSIMRHYCCARGYESITDLLDMYPDHVIEFTCMSKGYGTLGWNTVVWEVRNY